MPFSSQKLHEMLGLEGSVEDAGWAWDSDALQPGQILKRPTPLFEKLDEKVIASEEQRISQ